MTSERKSLLPALRRRLGVTASRNGIYIGTPRLLDIETHHKQVSFRTYRFVLTIPFGRNGRFDVGRTRW